MLIISKKHPNLFNKIIIKCPPIDFCETIVEKNKEYYLKNNEIKMGNIVISNKLINKLKDLKMDININKEVIL